MSINRGLVWDTLDCGGGAIGDDLVGGIDNGGGAIGDDLAGGIDNGVGLDTPPIVDELKGDGDKLELK